MNIVRRLIAHIRYDILCNSLKKSILSRGGVIGKNIRIVVDGTYQFGHNCQFDSEGIDAGSFGQIMILFGGNLSIGDNSGFSQSSIVCTKSITIGNNVKIGAGCLITDSNFHSLDYKQRRTPELDRNNAKREAVCIEDDVFIGARTIITKGVTIGARSIIASGSVVISNIPSDCIAGGNPCKVIKCEKNSES